MHLAKALCFEHRATTACLQGSKVPWIVAKAEEGWQGKTVYKICTRLQGISGDVVGEVCVFLVILSLRALRKPLNN